jgi:hypothetical protein
MAPKPKAPAGADSDDGFEKVALTDEAAAPAAAPPAAAAEPAAAGAPAAQEMRPEAAPPAERASAASPPPDPMLRELEEAAERLFAEGKEAGARLQEASEKVAKGAAKGAAAVASALSSLWSSLEAPGSAERGARARADDEALRARLGLGAAEPVLEAFRCSLLQRYAAANGLTPMRVHAFPGQLFVAAAHLCFELDRAPPASPPLLRLPAAAVTAFSREGEVVAVAARDAAGAELALAFGAFSLPALEADSCVARLEQMRAGAGGGAAS